MSPTYFPSPAAFRAWLRRNHDRVDELWVGYHKKGTGEPSMTWPESVAEALCYGWIDGVRRSVDERRYTIRFTPRRATSIWSAVNVALMKRLISEGRAQPPGIAAFERRTAKRTAVYGYEQPGEATLDPALEKTFRANAKAWKFFQSTPPGYRRQMLRRVMSAKRSETRERRLAQLITWSAEGRRIDAMAPARSR